MADSRVRANILGRFLVKRHKVLNKVNGWTEQGIGHHASKENRTASDLSSRCITRTIFHCHRVEHDDYCLIMAIHCAVLMFHTSIVASCWKSAVLCGTGLSIMYIVTSCLWFRLILAVLRGWGEGVSTLRGWIYSID